MGHDLISADSTSKNKKLKKKKRPSVDSMIGGHTVVIKVMLFYVTNNEKSHDPLRNTEVTEMGSMSLGDQHL